jgi:hypothetical protein
MEDMAQTRLSQEKKLLIHTLRWATNLPNKTSAHAKESASPTEAAGAAIPSFDSADGVQLEPLEHPNPLQLEQPVQTLDAAPDDNDDEVLLRFGGLPPSKVARSRSFSSRSCRAFGK